MKSTAGRFGFPSISLERIDEFEFDGLFLGIPFDLHTVTLPGSRYGPQFLAETCPVLDWHREGLRSSGLFSHEKSRLLFDRHAIADLGDLELVNFPLDSVSEFFSELESWTALMANHARVPVFIGGDHSLTFPVLNGLLKSRTIEKLIVLDAHSDFDPFFDRKNSPILHNNFTSHILEAHKHLEILQIGVRDYSLPPTSKGHRLKQLGPINPDDLLNIISPNNQEERVAAHLSIDVDVLDPTYFSHVSAPLANGYTFRDLQAVVEVLIETHDIQSVDVMEICPDRSRPPQQAMYLNYCILEVVSAILHGK
jgi:agmatinase